jgi:chemotaxis protein methyltransferase CheR
MLLEAVEAKYGYAFNAYAQGTLQRRITKLMTETKHDSFYTFQKAILTQAFSFERLFLELSIGITEFFRHPEQLAHLRNHVLPYLESFPHIRIWIAGCASGETVYSLAILLEEAGLLDKTQIYATDINPLYLQQARNGLYGIDNLKKIRDNYSLSGGVGTFDNYIEDHGRFVAIIPRLKEKILFYHHSLVSDGVFNEFQLIICSNVIIYFNKALQKKVMELFSRSLHKDGFLMLGLKEGINPGQGKRFFHEENTKMKIYRWKRIEV